MWQVAASFLFVSWLTIILAAILAAHDAKLAIRRFTNWREGRARARLKDAATVSTSTTQTPPSPQEEGPTTITVDNTTTAESDLPPTLHKLIQLLGHICDIQVVTALAIIVAGLAQWTRISYYHEILVTLYFQLTLDSFWAARVNYMDFSHRVSGVQDIPALNTTGSGMLSNIHGNNHSNTSGAVDGTISPTGERGSASYYPDVRLQIRRFAVLGSCILAVIWQFRLYFRENGAGPSHWSDGPSGPCYRYLDRSNPVAVLVVRTTGLIMFCLALGTMTFLSYRLAGRVHGTYSSFKGAITHWAVRRFCTSLEKYDELSRTRMIRESQKHSDDTTTTTTARQKYKSAGTVMVLKQVLVDWWKWTTVLGLLVINSFVLLVVFLLCQWLAIWTYGDGFYPLLWLCYFCFNVWNTLAVVSLIVLNRPLVDHEEMDWGFGQVLPVVLLLAIVFVWVDVFSRYVCLA